MEQAACAACLGPILRGSHFTLAGTEVFHRECLANVERSRSNLQAVKIIRLTGEVARERSEAARHRVERDDAANETRSARRARDHALAEVATYKALYEAGVANTAQALGEARAAMKAVADLRAAVIVPAPVTVRAKENDVRDATEIRFSLLELDTTCDNPEHDTENPGDRDAQATTSTTEDAADDQGDVGREGQATHPPAR